MARTLTLEKHLTRLQSIIRWHARRQQQRTSTVMAARRLDDAAKELAEALADKLEGDDDDLPSSPIMGARGRLARLPPER